MAATFRRPCPALIFPPDPTAPTSRSTGLSEPYPPDGMFIPNGIPVRRLLGEVFVDT